MMYLHYCKCCQRIHMLNGHKMFCPKCESKLTELRISYLDFVGMNREERNFLVQDCQNDALLAKMSANYRMYKYSKWYKSFLAAEQIGTAHAVSTFVSCDFLTTHPIRPQMA